MVRASLSYASTRRQRFRPDAAVGPGRAWPPDSKNEFGGLRRRGDGGRLPLFGNASELLSCIRKSLSPDGIMNFSTVGYRRTSTSHR